MKPDFQLAFKATIKHEGGYCYNINDRGGETYKGIARKWHPHWEGWQIIDVYKRKHSTPELNKILEENNGLQDMLRAFYYKNYWLPVHADDFTSEIANELFDTAVNQGVGSAISYLQEALNKLNRNKQDYPDINIDGVYGDKTLMAYQAYFKTERFSSRNKEKLQSWLLKWLNYFQLKRYDLITNKDLAQEVFVPGWTERV